MAVTTRDMELFQQFQAFLAIQNGQNGNDTSGAPQHLADTVDNRRWLPREQLETCRGLVAERPHVFAGTALQFGGVSVRRCKVTEDLRGGYCTKYHQSQRGVDETVVRDKLIERASKGSVEVPMPDRKTVLELCRLLHIAVTEPPAGK